MTTARENLSNWLRDAHAMERQAIELLEAQINRLEGYPEALPRLRSHLDETRAQQSQVGSACTGLAPTRRRSRTAP
jgi:ferritin-like metal-binding protein YciE